MKIIKFMSDDKKPLATSGDRKPSPLQSACMTQKEHFEQKERTLNYILDQIMFLHDFMDIKTLVDQKKIKSIDQLMDMGLGSKDFMELYIEDNNAMRIINLDQIGMLKQFCMYKEYLNSQELDGFLLIGDPLVQRIFKSLNPSP